MRAVCVCAPALVLGGCTISDGQGFARIEDAQVDVGLEDAGADAATASLVTDREYTVSLASATLDVRSLVLQGAVVPLSSEEDDGGDATALVSMPIDTTADLLAAATLHVERFLPSRELPEARVDTAIVGIGRLRIAGTVLGGPSGGALVQSIPLTVDVDVDGTIDETVSFDIAEDGPRHLHVSAKLRVDRAFLDGIDFAAIAQNGQVHIDAASNTAPLVATHVRGSRLEVSF